MDDPSKVQSESKTASPRQEMVGGFVAPTKRTEESSFLSVPGGSNYSSETHPQTHKQICSYDKADLDEYCLWLYGIYEESIINSSQRT